MAAAVIVLDLDGVIVKTNRVKHDAMLSLFADYPDRQASVSAFMVANGGVLRRVKLAALLQDCLNVKPAGDAIDGVIDRCAKALEHQLAVAPAVEGVEEFVAGWPGPRSVTGRSARARIAGQQGAGGFTSSLGASGKATDSSS